MARARELANGRYRLEGELGRGAMGVVYRARDTELGREVAIKALLDVDPQRAKRLRREAQAAAALRHPGIVALHGVFEEQGQPYLVYELVPGAETLDAAWRRLDLQARARLVRDAAAALGYAHAQGVVHRDVKPANLLVDERGKLRVADFGLALLGEEGRLTRTGAVLGTPAYMAPEQIAGSRKDVGPATDVWALGVTLYEGLSGRLPFDAPSLGELRGAVLKSEPPPPRRIDASIPRPLEQVILHALAKEPSQRPADGAAFAAELEQALAGKSPARRRGLQAWLIGLGLALTGLTLAGVVALARRPQAPAQPAHTARSPRPSPSATASSRVADRASRELDGLLKLDPAEVSPRLIEWVFAQPDHPRAKDARQAIARAHGLVPLRRLTHAEDCQRVSAQFLADGTLLSLGGTTGRVWDPDRPGDAPVRELLVGQAAGLTWCFGPQRRRAAAGRDDRLCLLDLESLAPASQPMLPVHLRYLAFAPDGWLWCSVLLPTAYRCRPLADPQGQLTNDPGFPVQDAAQITFSPDGATLGVACTSETVRSASQIAAVDVASGKQLWAYGLPDSPRCLAFAPDGSQLVSGGTLGILSAYAPRSGEQRGSYAGEDLLSQDAPLFGAVASHSYPAIDLVFSDDSSWLFSLATRAEDGQYELRSWDPTRFKERRRVLRRQGLACDLTLAPDQRTLAVALQGGGLELWQVYGDP